MGREGRREREKEGKGGRGDERRKEGEGGRGDERRKEGEGGRGDERRKEGEGGRRDERRKEERELSGHAGGGSKGVTYLHYSLHWNSSIDKPCSVYLPITVVLAMRHTVHI